MNDNKARERIMIISFEGRGVDGRGSAPLIRDYCSWIDAAFNRIVTPIRGGIYGYVGQLSADDFDLGGEG